MMLAAGAALAAPGLLTAARAQPAAAPTAAAQAPGFYRFKVGGFTVTTVHDGFGQRPNPTQGFVRNAQPAEVEAALTASFMPVNALTIPYTIPFLQTPGGLIAFDTGTGGQLGATAGRMVENMRAAGLDPAQVTTVIFTHFHGDHITGLTTAQDQVVFPNAEIIVPAPEWAFWMDEGNASRAPDAMKPAFAGVRRRFLPYQARIRQIQPGGEVMPGISSIATFGHTPGHTSYRLSDGGQQAIILGDVTNRPELNLVNPGWHIVFDQDPVLAEATRRRTFDMIATDRIRSVGYHWPFPANGYVAKDGNGYRFHPADWSSVV
jgi:glyoxylase-like metal-dependent hydrolase (beta-lactamase superfamily II)